MNLLKETIEDIRTSGYTPEDIIFIGSEDSGYSCSWGQFVVLADKEYDNSCGEQEVASDLIIVFTDGVKMWRHEYYGSENWEYSLPFKMPSETKPIKKLFVNDVGWENLAEINSVL